MMDAFGGMAIVANNLSKSYHSSQTKQIALDELNVNVPKGGVYGLLGPSGCGKTSFLRCVVGRLKADSGSLTVLGKIPGAINHGIPGPLVGYMPQELALYEKLSIEETLKYFGRLHGMSKTTMNQRIAFLICFLKLPEETRVIENLSGGQKRRVSFAIALLQEPPLVILDEPTVGVDPLLRQRIWDHLLEISQTSRTTIVITTHYIEEARQANKVGLMRNGRLLAESSPDELIRLYDMETLEDCFLYLCQYDQANNDIEDEEGLTVGKSKVDSVRRSEGTTEEQELLLTPATSTRFTQSVESIREKASKFCSPPKPRNILAIVIKSLIMLRRNIGFLLFQFLLPAFQILLFCLCIGGDPKDLPMAVVNNETAPAFGALYLGFIDDNVLSLHDFGNDHNAAYSSVQSGFSWGVIEIGKNFTQDLILRFGNQPIDNATISGGSIHLYLDMTNYLISTSIQQKTMEAFEEFARNVTLSLHMNPAIARLPIIIENPVYGDLHPKFTNFMAPGIILSITYFMATGLTALSFVLEKKEGLLDRSLVAAISAFEIMAAHIIAQTVVLVVQIAVLLIVTHLVFSVPIKGPIILEILMTLFSGLDGMALGLLISSISTNEVNAIQLSLGSLYPSLLISGIIWPIEAIPTWLRYISYGLPITFPAEAMRCILGRGWGLSYMHVWRGFLVAIGWGWGLMALSVLIIKLRII
ncbi:ABC transporter G family member 20-like isoform X2 [Tubulanus polymorphus]|uniref:ABC transporter G family member 20-like isoform X2 n=1 Tax=Tubulanus polymorphus TaxID=672921 RepID=UPI003DA24DA4